MMQEILNSFRPCHLGELEHLSLLSRVDVKYLISQSQLFGLLEWMHTDYHLLHIEDQALQAYKTIYLDTQQRRSFLDHANARPSRQKIRIRQYESTGACFLEVKHKRTEIGTQKSRLEWGCLQLNQDLENFKLSATDQQFLLDQKIHQRFVLNDLQPALWTNFKRITLVDFRFCTRITVDFNLEIGQHLNQLNAVQNLCILEIKKMRASAPTPLIDHLRQNNILRQSFSKYCMATVINDPLAKKNRFVKQLQFLNSLKGESHG